MILFVSGIDTGIGKTVATGLLARAYAEQGVRVITQKLVQTGCADASEDIAKHRRLMGVPAFDEDRQGLTCPAVFPLAASPHLAAEQAGRPLDIDQVLRCTAELATRYPVVLVEGAGGVCVPLTRTLTTLDLLARTRWPVILVSSARLGSINHTLLSLAALRERGIPLAAVVYNRQGDSPAVIADDTCRVIRDALCSAGTRVPILELPAGATAVPAAWRAVLVGELAGGVGAG